MPVIWNASTSYNLSRCRNSIRSRSPIKLKMLPSRCRFWTLCNARASELQTDIQVLRPNGSYDGMTVYATVERGAQESTRDL
jgi:hypothetical protein